jgi:hypothetical protein
MKNLSDETIEDLAIRELMKAEVEVNHTINGHIRIKNTNLEHNSLIALMLSDLTE